MFQRLILILTLAVTATAQGAVIENNCFTLTTSDDSWTVNTDPNALRGVGGRVEMHRSDARRAITELARIDFIETAFCPEEYLRRQVVGKQDIFCRAAEGFGNITDTTFATMPAKHVAFAKRQGELIYRCEAVALNAGYNTLLVITAHRSDVPNIVKTVVGSMQLLDTARLVTAAQLAQGAREVLLERPLPISHNERLTMVTLSPDSTTVEMEVAIDYINRDNVQVSAFVQAMRNRWLQSLPDAYRLNSLMHAIVDEQKTIRYVYLDNKDNEIGTLLITPAEYLPLVNRQETPKEPK